MDSADLVCIVVKLKKKKHIIQLIEILKNVEEAYTQARVPIKVSDARYNNMFDETILSNAK